MIKKILCSLIIGFGLLSFSNAGFLEIDLPGDGYQGRYGHFPYAYYVDKNLNFYTNSTYNFFQFTFDTSSDLTRSWLLFWNDNKLYSYGNFRNSIIYGQGYIKNGCVSNVFEFNSKCLASCYGAVGDCGARPDIFSNYQDSLSGFYNGSLGNFNKFLFTNLNGENILAIACFIGDINVVCVGNPITYGFNDFGQNDVGNLISSIGQYPNSFENEINNGIFHSSPFSSSSVPSIPDYEFNEDDTYTNKEIIQGYNAMGLTDDFCYGGFDIDNIFESGTVPQQFTGYKWGGGAFIFDIWDIYSGAYNNDYISFLRSFYISYENNNYSDFYGKTKALYGFINQWFSVSSKGLGFIESTAPTFTLVDVWQYCDLRFNQNPDSIYTGDRRDPKFRYYTSGQVNLGGYFNFSGNNNYFSGNLSGFNTPKDFFSSLNSIFQGGLNNLENREPVLPSYIIIIFLAIIFIRIISH